MEVTSYALLIESLLACDMFHELGLGDIAVKDLCYLRG